MALLNFCWGEPKRNLINELTFLDGYKMIKGLFVGLTTLDFLYRVGKAPLENQKMAAEKGLCVTGGPTTNAALVFAHLGGQVRLLSAIGNHPISNIIKLELKEFGVEHVELTPNRNSLPDLASVIISNQTGSRTIVGAVDPSIDTIENLNFDKLLEEINLVYFDCHQLRACLPLAKEAKKRNIKIIVDAGFFNPLVDELLNIATAVICSANFKTLKSNTKQTILSELSIKGIEFAAISDGEHPLVYRHLDSTGEIVPDKIQAIDTLAAGDTLQGAFSYFISKRNPNSYIEDLTQASKIASKSCLFFGPRTWMKYM